MTHSDLSPQDFVETAEQAVAACAHLPLWERALRLAGDGLLGVIAPEHLGGLGLSLPFAVPVITAAGAGLLAFPLLETMVLARMLAGPLPALAERLVAGDALVSIGWSGQASLTGTGANARLCGICGRAPFADAASHVLVALAGGGAALVPTDIAGVTIQDGAGLSIESPEHVVILSEVPVTALTLIPQQAFSDLVAQAQLLSAATILGSAEAALAMAVTHVSDRRQFGKALVANQAIRHLLARHKLHLEGIRQSINRALVPDDLGALQIRSAFIHAATTGISIAEGALQLHGGMGFTWDVPVHRHLRQIRALALRGNSEAALLAIADALIDQGANAA